MRIKEDIQYAILQTYGYLLRHNCKISVSKINNKKCYILTDDNGGTGLVLEKQPMFQLFNSCGI